MRKPLTFPFALLLASLALWGCGSSGGGDDDNYGAGGEKLIVVTTEPAQPVADATVSPPNDVLATVTLENTGRIVDQTGTAPQSTKLTVTGVSVDYKNTADTTTYATRNPSPTGDVSIGAGETGAVSFILVPSDLIAQLADVEPTDHILAKVTIFYADSNDTGNTDKTETKFTVSLTR